MTYSVLTSETSISDEFAIEIATTCRTGIGDTLRGVIHFTPSESELLSLWNDTSTGATRSGRWR
ncbi:DUF7522 family protein [Haladaptatus pallidirubidus]|uniref:DUF7522 family protein n=1 Tax=Haladaptatus pallidirubidus TaxID=1008152 RepID=UPI003386D2AC